LHHCHVGTSAKSPASTRKDYDEGLGVVVRLQKETLELCVHRLINGIHHCRPIHPRNQDLANPLEG
jgi:hypothetical protein